MKIMYMDFVCKLPPFTTWQNTANNLLAVQFFVVFFLPQFYMCEIYLSVLEIVLPSILNLDICASFYMSEI